MSTPRRKERRFLAGGMCVGIGALAAVLAVPLMRGYGAMVPLVFDEPFAKERAFWSAHDSAGPQPTPCAWDQF
jgi:hypothetical protein